MKQAILTLLTAIAISAVAAYFSIVGLAALFAATATGVIVMASVLEVGKIVTVKWVHSMWKNHRVKLWFKAVLMSMVAALMAVTSLGIYGYLSKGHLEQNAPLTGIELQSSGLERQVAQREAENQRLETRLTQIDQNISSFLTQDQATKGLNASERLASERTRIQQQIDANYQEINRLSEQLVPLKEQSNEVEAKLGPVKYVAELFGFSDPETAVRIVILLIMFAFDPLAICLVIAASISYEDWLEKRNGKVTPPVEPTPDSDDDAPEVDRLAKLRAELFADAHATREEHAEAKATIAAERDDLDIKRATLEHALVELVERERRVEQYASDVDEAEAVLRSQLAELTEAAQVLDQREKELNDRVDLLELIFPRGATDDQAIVSMLERNPKVLEDIIEVIEAAKSDEPLTNNINMMVKRDPE